MSNPSKRSLQKPENDSQTVTVLAPTFQDAKYCDQILREHGVLVELVDSVYEVTTRIREGAGVVLIAQEFLTGVATDHLRCAVNDQPSWSDVPILVLLAQRETSARVIAELLTVGHVTLIERPLRIAILVSTLKAKLRDRARQYEVRDLLLKAQSANASKSEFLANMSHEIRTPMTAILGYAEMLGEYISNDDALSYLATIRRNGDYLLTIINDILDLSKIESGKLDIDQERFEPHRVIEDVRSIMEVRAKEGGLKLNVEYDSELPRIIQSDAKRWKQILINLVGNAVKFTPKGSVCIRIKFDAANNRLHVDVVDTGIGVSNQQLERLFKPFSQGDASVTRGFGGTGLGLAISKRLAEMLGGAITVKSTEGVGSTFTVTISTGNLQQIPMIGRSEMVEQNSTDEPLIEVKLNAHILIVDDRRDIRFLSKHILSKAGARITEAKDGLVAIETAKRAAADGIAFDLILLDMQMPNLDGYETAAALRRLGYSRPIIALTADAMQGDMNKCLEAGCNDYLSKPIDKAVMLQKIDSLLKS